MSAGKASAQAVHATMMLQDNLSGVFTSSYRRTVVVLEADSAQQIKSLSEYLDTAGLFSQYYIDEGENEIAPYSITALAVEPFDSNNEEFRAIFAPFKLFELEEPTYDEYKVAQDVLRMFLAFDGAPKYVRKTLNWLRQKT